MTAEVVVLNRSAVVLAADSRVTSQVGDETDYIDGIDKIFPLSDVHPVAVMVYNNMAFGKNAYWKDVVEAYRESKGLDAEPTVDAWTDDLIAFAAAYGNICKSDRTRNLQRVLEAYFQGIESRARTAAAGTGSDVSALFERIVDASGTELCGPALSQAEIETLKRTHGPVVEAVARRTLAGGDARILAKCSVLAWRYLESFETSEMHTGIVVAGYGAEETYAAVAWFETDGHLGSVYKASKGQGMRLDSDGSGAAIIPFAQRDMTDLFLTGVSPDFLDAVARTCSDELAACLNAARPLMPAAHFETLKQRFDDARSNIIVKLVESRDEYEGRTVTTVANNYGARELADFARSFVDVTSFRRNRSTDERSVGGSIRTALIEKDGGRVAVVSRA